MATFLNINGGLDKYERYKMPKLEVRYNEGRKKTYVTNLIKICVSLNRDFDLVKLYIKKKLSTAVNWKKKQEELEIGGIYKVEDLQDILQNLITDYILCRECNNPETKLRLKSKGDSLSMKCDACGTKSVIKRTDVVFESILKLYKQKMGKKKKKI